MKTFIGLVALLPMYGLLLITSLIARSMAVVSATLANTIIIMVFWTKNKKLIDYALGRFGYEDNTKETK